MMIKINLTPAGERRERTEKGVEKKKNRLEG
jgi:hypothetical protein